MLKSIWQKYCIYLFLLFLSIITLAISIYFHVINLEYISSIFSNLFAGTVTGCIIAIISAVKNRKKTKIIIMKNTYERLFDKNFEFLEYHSNLPEIEDEVEFLNCVEEKCSKFITINERLIQLSNEVLSKDEFNEVLLKQFKYNANDYKKCVQNLREEIENFNFKQDREKILKKIREFEIAILMLNINFMKEIRKYDNDIYAIDQLFI